jgi:hypothetical protein
MNTDSNLTASGSSPPADAPRPRPDFTLYGLSNPTPKPPASRPRPAQWPKAEALDRLVPKRRAAHGERPRGGICRFCSMISRARNADDVCARCARTSVVPAVPPTSTGSE